MLNKIRVQVEPIGKRFFLDGSKNCLDALTDAGIGIKSLCAGNGTCGKCRVVFLEDEKRLVTKQENEILTQDEIEKGVRLACQQVIDKETSLYIPASSLSEEQKLQVLGDEANIEVDQVCKKYHLKLKRADLSDMQSDFSRIQKELLAEHNEKVEKIDLEVLRVMPEVIRKNSWEITVTVREGEIINVEPKDATGRNFGIAVDLGTTKIAVLLVDLLSGDTVDKKGAMNPQIRFGEDVMSRINYAIENKDNAIKLHRIVVEKINETITELCKNNDIEKTSISEVSIVGNTAMHHLLIGLPVRQLGLSPFVSLTDKPLSIKARDMSIDIAEGGYVYLLPPIAGYVGSDHLAMVLASEIEDKEGNYLGIDIGTNTEIAMKSSKGIFSVSTASGPAFEGAHIKFGMRAAPGAIERVVIDNDNCEPKIQTINDKKPVGICGSGILDAIAELRKVNIIDQRGKFKPEKGCVCKDTKGNFQFVLDPDINSGNGEDKDLKEMKHIECPEDGISINQKDIVEIQLAKSAIRTGIEVLLENAGLTFKDIDKIIIAGAFGSYIDPRNVINIGMFPRVDLERISQVGNAAGVGSKMVLVSAKIREKAERLAKKMDYLELTMHPSFTDHFAKSTLFPDPEDII